jgi:hypothetical protein
MEETEILAYTLSHNLSETTLDHGSEIGCTVVVDPYLVLQRP